MTPKREMYAPGKGYHIFAGKDASKGLGMSSLKPEDAVSDYSSLDDKQLKVLDDWVRCGGEPDVGWAGPGRRADGGLWGVP